MTIDGEDAFEDDEFDGLAPKHIIKLASERCEEIRKQDAESTIMRGMNEQEAGDALTFGFARAVDAGFDRKKCDEMIGSFANSTQCRKGDLLDVLDEKIEQVKPAEKRRLTTKQLVEQQCKLTISHTEDSNQDTTYVWDFGDAVVETNGSGSSGKYHLKEHQFADEILAARDQRPRNSPLDPDEWTEFISDYIANHHHRITYTPSVRTVVLNEIEDRITDSVAWHPIEMIESSGGVFIPQDDDTHDGGEDEIWVPSTIVHEILDEHSVSRTALRHEMSAKGYIPDRKGGAPTERVSVGNKNKSFWVFNRSFAEPEEYIVGPEGTATKSEQMQRVADRIKGDGQCEQEAELPKDEQ